MCNYRHEHDFTTCPNCGQLLNDDDGLSSSVPLDIDIPFAYSYDHRTFDEMRNLLSSLSLPEIQAIARQYGYLVTMNDGYWRIDDIAGYPSFESKHRLSMSDAIDFVAFVLSVSLLSDDYGEMIGVN